MEDQATVAAAVQGVQEPGRHEPIESGLQSWRVRHLLQKRNLHPPSDHGSGLQDRRVGPGEQIDSTREELLDRGRHRLGVPAGLCSPDAVPAREAPSLLQRPQELLDEERIACSPVTDECAKAVLDVASKQAADERSHAFLVERLEVDRPPRQVPGDLDQRRFSFRTGDQIRGRGVLRSHRCTSSRVSSAEEPSSPVHVLDGEHQRPLLRPARRA